MYIEILLVEDNPGDVYLTREALKEGKLYNQLHVVQDGLEAMAFLHQEGRYRTASRPDLILLDPRKDGREVLAEITADPDLADIPVVVLITSKSEEDVLKTHALHASCCITKPIDVSQLIGAIRMFEHFGLTVVKLNDAA